MKTIILITGIILVWQVSLTNTVISSNSTELERADYCFNNLKYDSAEYYYNAAIMKIDKIAFPELYCYLLNQYAMTLFWQDRLEEAAHACRNSLKRCNETLGPLHSETAQAHINLGIFKFVSGQYGTVSEHFYEAVFVLENFYGNSHPKVARAYEWLGTYFESRSDTAKARNYLWKSLKLYEENLGKHHPDVAELYRYIGLFYKRFAAPDSAIYYFELAKELFDQKYGEANFHSVKCLNNISDVYEKQYHQWHKVQTFYQHCMELIPKFKSPNRYTEAMTLYRMHEYFKINKDYLNSIDYLNQILQLYFCDFKNRDVFDNPLHVKNFPFTIPKLVLISKAGLLVKQAEIDTTNKIDYLKAASDCYLLLDQIMDAMCGNLFCLEDRLYFANSHAKLYYDMALHELRLYELGLGDQFITNALYYSEKKKLTEQALKYNDDRINNHQLKGEWIADMIQINKEINALKSAQAMTENKNKFEKLITQKTLEADAHFTEKTTLSDSTFQLYNDPKAKTIIDIQNRLKKDECLLYYAEITQDYKQIPYELLIVAVNSKEVKIAKVDGQETFRLVSVFYSLVASGHSIDTINVIGTQLYNKLLAPVCDLLKWKIIIHPSAYLAQLSFETLPDINYPVKPPMLIDNHLIWKIFSLNDLFENEMVHFSGSNDSLLAVAPSYNNTKAEEIALLAQRDAGLINLAGAARECSMIADHFNTYLLGGYSASKEKFSEICTRFPYIHISTHGTPVADNMEIVQLAFNSTNGNDNGWLNFYEILNLDINAELVVLSACKTGVGKRNNGEGNLNLAWAFRQAGARAAIISLWDVSDYASSQIMPDFYKFLSDGYSKPEALRLAKLKFIANHDQLAASPFYWAAFDFVGYCDRDSVVKNAIYGKLLGFAAILFVVIGLTFLIFKHHNRNQSLSPDLFQ
jgi:CHAT domain-containing protein